MSEKICKTCVFGHGFGSEGECHRRAPVVIQYDEKEYARPHGTLWPEVSEDDFCGEWKEKGNGLPN